jgi:hypothetical protein
MLRLAPEIFSVEVPKYAIALACTAVRLNFFGMLVYTGMAAEQIRSSLEELYQGKSLDFSELKYSNFYNRMCQIMDELPNTDLVADARFKNRRCRWAQSAVAEV